MIVPVTHVLYVSQARKHGKTARYNSPVCRFQSRGGIKAEGVHSQSYTGQGKHKPQTNNTTMRQNVAGPQHVHDSSHVHDPVKTESSGKTSRYNTTVRRFQSTKGIQAYRGSTQLVLYGRKSTSLTPRNPMLEQAYALPSSEGNQIEHAKIHNKCITIQGRNPIEHAKILNSRWKTPLFIQGGKSHPGKSAKIQLLYENRGKTPFRLYMQKFNYCMKIRGKEAS